MSLLQKWALGASGGAVVVVAIVLAVVLSGHSKPPKASASDSTTTSSSAGTTTTSIQKTKTSATSTTSTTSASDGPTGTPVPAGFSPQSATFVSTAEGFVLGKAPCNTGTCTTIVRTTDAGKTWLAIPAPDVALSSPSAGGGGVDSIRFADPLDGWVFGSTLWSTHDGGAKWSKVSLPASVSADTVLSLAASAGRVYALFGGSTSPAQLLATTPTSDSWSVVVSNAGILDEGKIVLQGSSGWLLANGPSGELFLRSEGSSWVKTTAPCGPPAGAPALAAASPTEIFAVCSGGAAAGQQPKNVLASTTAGQSFVQVGQAPPGGDLDDIAIASPSVEVVAASSGASYLYRSTDGGSAWSTVIADPSLGGAPFHDLGFTTSQQGIVIEGDAYASGSRFLMTYDAGATWQAITF